MRGRMHIAVAVAVAAFVAPAEGQEGLVRGTVSYRGTPPPVEKLKVTSDRDVCGESVPSRHLLVERGRIRNAVVYLEGARGPVVPAPVTLSNRNCEFEPPVLVSHVGAMLALRNEDPVMHNVHLYHSKRTVANVSLPTRGLELKNRRALARPGVVEAKCDAHDWMRAAIWVFEHPYYAVTGADGTFEIAGLAPGNYTVRVWHATLGEQTREVVVTPGKASTVEFSFPAGSR